MAIIMYENIFTHAGQSDVNDFIKEIRGAINYIKRLKKITVYVGVHGNSEGKFLKNFTDDEMRDTRKMVEDLSNVALRELRDGILTKESMKTACDNGSVFFTWCDSDKTLKKYGIDLGNGKKVNI